MLKKMIVSSVICSLLIVTSSYAEAPSLPSTDTPSSSSEEQSSASNTSSSSPQAGSSRMKMNDNNLENNVNLIGVAVSGDNLNAGIDIDAEDIEMNRNDIENNVNLIGTSISGDNANTGISIGNTP